MQNIETHQETEGAVMPADTQGQELLASTPPKLSGMASASEQHDELQAGHWLGTSSTTLNAIERLRATIDEETEKLEGRAVVDFDSFSQRKNRGLLELTRSIRLMTGEGVDPRVVPQLTGLRMSLVKNQAALQVHLDAVREVSAIIAKSIQEVESDGTYSLIASRKPK